jgi:hypothetical protein
VSLSRKIVASELTAKIIFVMMAVICELLLLSFHFCLATVVALSFEMIWQPQYLNQDFHHCIKGWTFISNNRNWSEKDYNYYFDSLTNVYASHYQEFTYSDIALLSSYFHDYMNDYITINITASYLFHLKSMNVSTIPMTYKLNNELKSIQYLYYSGNIMNNNFHHLKSLIDSNCFFGDQKVTSLIWIGTKDVIATPHYDAVYNVYIQISGYKTFYLLSPQYNKQLFFYGRFHPHACQSRIYNLLKPKKIYRSYYTVLKESLYSTDQLKSFEGIVKVSTCL